MACPVAFGEVGVKTRVKGVFGYKKPALWLIVGSVTVCALTAVCFLTNPKACFHSYQTQVIVASTCTERGMDSHTCILCGYSYAAPVDVCAHTYDEGVVLQASTCVEQGVKELTCMDCGTKKTEPIALTAHIDGEHIISVEPNCSQEGQVTTTCTYCQASYVVEILPTNDVHDLQETVVKASTCTEKGEGIRQCIRCDYSESVSYEAAGHNYVLQDRNEGRCGYEGYAYWHCSECTEWYTETLGIGEHLWKYYSYNKKQCEYCGWIVSESSGSLYGNSFNTGTSPHVPPIFDDDPFTPSWPWPFN